MAALSRSTAEPPARYYHAAIGFGQSMFVCAGKGSGGSAVPSSVLESFNVLSTTWQEPRQLRSQSPDCYQRMAVASDGRKAYWFGGIGGINSSSLYCLDLSSLSCQEVVPTNGAESPTPRGGSAMVSYRRKLVIYGGSISLVSFSEVYVFDLNTKTWTAQATTGEKPPALDGHTLTMVDDHRAVLFGGSNDRKSYNDVTYILDMETWEWSKLQTSEKKPRARDDHAACCIAGHLMVVGGYGGHVLSDVWLLDVSTGLWSEVTLPTGITQRYGHSAILFGTGPDVRVVVLFGGIDSHLGMDAISETTLLLLSQKRGSWVVERVVGSGELGAPDDSLREQLKRLQITRSHHHYDSQFPGVCFLEKPLEVPVQSEPVTISPPGLGVTLKIPHSAVRPDADKPVNVAVQACLSGSTFIYPEGCTLLSAVYHISADSHFEKEVDVTFDHFAELKTEKQASAMTIFRAESRPTVEDGKAQFIFSPIDGGKFAVGGAQCTFSTQESSLLSAGSKESAEIRKRYIALCSFTEGVQDVGHATVARAAVAVSLHNDVYITNFRKALEEEWNISSANRSELNVSFKEPEACVDYPSRVEGWDIFSSSSPCILPEENVDFPKPEDLSLYDYPPRVVFEMTPSVNSKPCILQFKLTGMNKDINFRIPLRETKRRMTISVGATERPCLKDLMHLSTREGKDIRIIEESATSYCQIGTILLEDKRGNKVDTILHDAGGKMTETITEVYKKWMKEDPNYSWMKLTQCFRECSLNSLASDIEQHFGLPSPLESRADTTCTESDLARMQGDKILLVTPKDEQPSATDGTQRNQCRCC